VTADLRIAYLQLVLGAIAGSPAAERDRAVEYIRVLDRGQCAASSERMESECLMAATRRWCASRDPKCTALADATISNLLAEKQLVPSERRSEITKGVTDARKAVDREILRVAGTLAVDFRLRTGDPIADDAELARRIDRYCLEAGDNSGLPWQACASTLAWYLRAR
jgi:hypothetical protein